MSPWNQEGSMRINMDLFFGGKDIGRKKQKIEKLVIFRTSRKTVEIEVIRTWYRTEGDQYFCEYTFL